MKAPQRAKHIEKRTRAATDKGATNRRPRDDRWEDLLRVSAAVFAQQGYSATSLQSIAERIGILKGSLYYYINSKEDLLFEIIHGVLDQAITGLEELAAAPKPAVERLHDAIVFHVKYLIQKHTETTVFLHEFQRLSRQRRRQIPSARYEEIFKQLIEEAQAEKSIRPELDPVIAARLVLGATNWIYRWYRPTEVTNPDKLSEEIANQLIRGIAVSG
jgi:TetR/AcrR family transcriptional regulator, cholesterol catabolism regulator